jgi:hypothetical protein
VDEVIRAIKSAVTDEHKVEPSRIALLKPKTIPKTSSGKLQVIFNLIH